MIARKNKWLLTGVQMALLVWSGTTFAIDRVYVANEGADMVSVHDATSFDKLASVPVGQTPHNVQVSPDGKFVWVTNNGEPGQATDSSSHKGATHAAHGATAQPGAVWVIDTNTNAVVAQVAVGTHPAHVLVSPDGHFAFVSLSQENAVAVINPVTRKVVRRIEVGPGPIQLYATPNSSMLLVANQGTREKPGKTVSTIDLETFNVAKSIVTDAGPHGVVVDREGRFAYVTNIHGNSVSVLDLFERQVTKTVPVGKSPNGISITP